MYVKELLVDDMREEDLPKVIEIENISFPSPWSYNSFYLELDKNKLARYFCARCMGDIVGYSGLWIVLGEAHITTLAVHPFHRGRGIGALLMDQIISCCRGCGVREVTLEVRESNMAARLLYDKFGFVVMGKRKNYYRHENALVMTLTLEAGNFEE